MYIFPESVSLGEVASLLLPQLKAESTIKPWLRFFWWSAASQTCRRGYLSEYGLGLCCQLCARYYDNYFISFTWVKILFQILQINKLSRQMLNDKLEFEHNFLGFAILTIKRLYYVTETWEDDDEDINKHWLYFYTTCILIHLISMLSNFYEGGESQNHYLTY